MKTLGVAMLLLACAAGCGSQTVTKPPATVPAPSGDVIRDMKSLYINRDVQEYGKILSSDYVFRFVPDPVSGHEDSLSRAEELNFGNHLFVTGSTDGQEPPALSIRLTIDTTSSEPDNRRGHTGWVRYYVQTSLTLTQTNGAAHNVNGPAIFYFKQEPAGSGVWKLAEWQDEPVSSRGTRVSPQGATPTARTSWGSLKKIFR